MVVEPKFRGFICTAAHPVGCRLNVKDQITYVENQGKIAGAPKRVLVIGSSTGYGLASRIAAAFGAEADTIGVYFEKPAGGKRTGTAGWYNNQAFEEFARAKGLLAEGINGDAFSNEIKEETIQRIQEKMPGGQVDLIVYSLASPRRTDPVTQELYTSVIKPIGQSFTSKTVDFHSGAVSEVSIEPAGEEEIRQTIAVMGGEDWRLWMDALDQAGVIARQAVTVAYSYIGPDLTHAVYKDGTIGRAKEDLEAAAADITAKLTQKGVKAYISVNKALVTQSSSAIPVVGLYMSLLFQVMKEKGTHEDCIQQMYRMLAEKLYGETVLTDAQNRIRLDDWEMDPEVQEKVHQLWDAVNTENLPQIGDLHTFRQDFFRLFGFGRADVAYEADVEV